MYLFYKETMVDPDLGYLLPVNFIVDAEFNVPVNRRC